MRLFHGTVAYYLPAVKKMGLMPSAKNAWKAQAWNGGDLHEAHAVYLTTSETHAKSYAESKVAYLAAEPGSTFPLYGDLSLEMVKHTDAPVIHTSPVLVVVEIEEGDPRLTQDPDDSSASFMYRGAIPPSSIHDIQDWPMPTSVDDDPIRKELVTETLEMMQGFAALFGSDQPSGRTASGFTGD